MAGLNSLVVDRPSRAAPGWLLVGVLVATTVERLLAGDVLWAGFSALVIAVALVPVVLRDPATMVSWPVLALSALPAVARAAGYFVQPMGYVSVAALGLLIVAEIDRFSAAEMPGWFAAAMVVMATMSAASGWTIARYGASRLLGSAAIPSVDALMWDLAVATAVGIAFGAAFELAVRSGEDEEEEEGEGGKPA